MLKPKRTSLNGVEILKELEALRLKPYDDKTGKRTRSWCPTATIGYGHLIRENEWPWYREGITEEEAESLLRRDLIPAEDAVQRSVKVKLNQNQFDACVIFAFNIGPFGFSSSSACKLINDSEAQTPYSSLESAWKAWRKQDGKILRGLVNRRAREWKLYTTEV